MYKPKSVDTKCLGSHKQVEDSVKTVQASACAGLHLQNSFQIQCRRYPWRTRAVAHGGTSSFGMFSGWWLCQGEDRIPQCPMSNGLLESAYRSEAIAVMKLSPCRWNRWPVSRMNSIISPFFFFEGSCKSGSQAFLHRESRWNDMEVS